MKNINKNYLWISLVASPLFAKNYIVGGADVKAKDPVRAATVGIYQPAGAQRGGSLCTGTIVGKNVALTAAHCLQPNGAKPAVIFGRDLHGADVSARQASAVAVNPKWQEKSGQGMDQGDIALVKFPGPLPQGYHQVPLARSESDLKPGTKAILAGYGIANAATREGAGKLRKTEVQIAKNRPGKGEMIVDQSRGHGACHGDSGGPAFVKEKGKTVLGGVTNRSYPKRAPDDCQHKAVYTKVPAYRPWIQKSEKKLEAQNSAATPELRHRMSTPKLKPAQKSKRVAAKAKSEPKINKEVAKTRVSPKRGEKASLAKRGRRRGLHSKRRAKV